MTYNDLLTRVIDDGIAAARVSYATKPDHLRGSVDGFNVCRGKPPAEIEELWRTAGRTIDLDGPIDEYWYGRCFQLELEWVLNVISMAVVQAGGDPLLSWLPTMRGAIKYAEIVGVREQVATP